MTKGVAWKIENKHIEQKELMKYTLYEIPFNKTASKIALYLEMCTITVTSQEGLGQRAEQICCWQT